MRCLKSLITCCLVLGLSACGNSGDGSPSNLDDDPMNSTDDEDRDVTLDARVRSWSDTQVLIDYTIANTGSLELIVFDVGSNTTTGLDDEEQVTLYQAKRDTGMTNFESPPTIGGRNLSPGQTLDGSAKRQIPISIDFIGQLSSLTPDTIELCIGYGNADDIIPTTRADGLYPLNEHLDLQALVCSALERSSLK